MGKQRGKSKDRIVYDWHKETRVTCGDDGEEKIISETTSGQWLDCFPEEAVIKGLRDHSPDHFVQKDCSCGRHRLYWLRVPPLVWPDNPQEWIRVIERDSGEKKA